MAAGVYAKRGFAFFRIMLISCSRSTRAARKKIKTRNGPNTHSGSFLGLVFRPPPLLYLSLRSSIRRCHCVYALTAISERRISGRRRPLLAFNNFPDDLVVSIGSVGRNGVWMSTNRTYSHSLFSKNELCVCVVFKFINTDIHTRYILYTLI